VQQKFHDKIFSQEMFYCSHCKECFFDMTCSSKGPVHNNPECKRCEIQRHDEKNGHVRRFAAENDLDPYPHYYPSQLPVLFMIEEMMISRIHIIMKSYRLKSGSVRYKGNVINCEQDFAEHLLRHLPLLPKDLPIFIVRLLHQHTPTGYRDF